VTNNLNVFKKRMPGGSNYDEFKAIVVELLQPIATDTAANVGNWLWDNVVTNNALKDKRVEEALEVQKAKERATIASGKVNYGWQPDGSIAGPSGPSGPPSPPDPPSGSITNDSDNLKRPRSSDVGRFGYGCYDVQWFNPDPSGGGTFVVSNVPLPLTPILPTVLNNIGLGTDVYQRQTRRIDNSLLEFKAWITPVSLISNFPATCRLICVYDKSNNYEPTSLGKVLYHDTGTITLLSTYNHNFASRFQILFDETFQLSMNSVNTSGSGGSPQTLISKKVDLRGLSTFYGPTAVVPSENMSNGCISFFLWCDQTNQFTCTYYSTIFFKQCK